MSEPAVKRYRREEKSSGDESSGEYVPYVSVRERRRQQLARLGRVAQLATEAAQDTKSSSDNDHEDEGLFVNRVCFRNFD